MNGNSPCEKYPHELNIIKSEVEVVCVF